MRKILGYILFLFVSVSTIYSQTNVSGGIYTNTVWTLANSPYIMTGSVVIFPGKTLTIEPGVEVRVQGNDPNTGLQLYLEVRGTLNATGTAAAPILFISDIPNETYYTWQGINIKGDQGGDVILNHITLKNTMYGINDNVATTDTLALTGCNFMYNNYAIWLNTNVKLDSCTFTYNGVGVGVMMVSGSVTANHCLFDHNYANLTTIANGMYLYNTTFSNSENGIIQAFGVIDNCLFTNNLTAIQESGGLTITNSTFTDNGTAIKGLTGSTILNCTFSQNALALELGDNSVVENNFLNENEVGLALAVNTPGQLVSNVKNNQICNNLLFNVENRTSVNLGLEKNCFCESDSTIIETLIYDGYDDITRGLFNYAIYDSACQNIIAYVQKVDLGTTDIPQQNQYTVSLYPNPTIDKIVATSNNPQWMNTSLTLMDFQGKIIRENLSFENGKTEITTESLSPGLYLLKENGTEKSYKFVKQ